MNTVRIRNIELGAGIPKICVPIVATTKEGILAEAESFKELTYDLVEWRVDWYEDVDSLPAVLDTLKSLRNVLGDKPLLMTFRTDKEGGARAISDAYYKELNVAAAQSGDADLIDVEIFSGDELVSSIITAAHKCGVKVVGSNHNFHKTPSKEELIRRLCKMQEMDADLPKIAVMPTCKADVLTLLSATEEMTRVYADRPIITMSMSATGVISRLCGEVFGSALTFGAAKQASAPGQMGVQDLSTILSLLHKSL